MVKKIKFPLEMSEDVKVRTLEELREHFDLEKVIAYYMDGKLLTWLNDRYYENEVSQISQLDKTNPVFKKKLCEILGVDIEIECEIDLEMIERRNAKLTKLKQFTTDSEIIRNVDSVAFDQEELADLIDDNVSPIYLYGERFNIPLSKENITYIGVNSPMAVINSKTIVDFDSRNIKFKNITFNEEYLKLTPKKETSQFPSQNESSQKERPLTSLEILEQLPKIDCQECGSSSCLAFALAMINGKINLDLCPHVSVSAKKALRFTILPVSTTNSENSLKNNELPGVIGGRKRILTSFEILEQLPKIDCQECGSSSCLAFALAMINDKVTLDMCPFVSAFAKESLGFTAK